MGCLDFIIPKSVRLAAELISLGVIFFCAIIGGLIAARFKQPAVFGLLLVGAIIGPSSLNLVQDSKMVVMMADFGAILMLFIIGLEFDISKLMKLGARSILIGLLKFAIVLFFGYETTLFLGFSSKVALFVGVILSFSSTIVVVKVLEQKEMFNRREVPLLIAVLIIEDILAVFVLTFFSGVKDSSKGFLSLFEHIFFAIAILVLAYFLVMRILKYVVNELLKNDNDESVLTFLSLGLGALFSYFASWLGLTPSAGAFLAGSLVASLPNAKDYGRAIHPYALIFTSVFFIAMGTFVDFKSLNDNIPLIAALLITIFISRFIAIGFLTYLLANFKNEQPVFSSLAMISVGEFSLLVAKESEKFGLGIDLVTITASIIFISAIIMSMSINYSESINNALGSRVPLKTKFKLERISNYMRKFFDQVEIESHFTKKMKSESKGVFIIVLVALFAFFMLRRISLQIQAAFPTYVLYGFYAIGAILIFYLLNLIYRRMAALHHTLSVILTNVDSSRNLKKCTKILNTLLIALGLFFSAMFFPFAMFAFNLNPWANLVPLVLVIAAFYYIRNFILLIEGNQSSISFATNVAAAKF